MLRKRKSTTDKLGDVVESFGPVLETVQTKATEVAESDAVKNVKKNVVEAAATARDQAGDAFSGSGSAAADDLKSRAATAAGAVAAGAGTAKVALADKGSDAKDVLSDKSSDARDALQDKSKDARKAWGKRAGTKDTDVKGLVTATAGVLGAKAATTRSTLSTRAAEAKVRADEARVAAAERAVHARELAAEKAAEAQKSAGKTAKSTRKDLKKQAKKAKKDPQGYALGVQKDLTKQAKKAKKAKKNASKSDLLKTGAVASVPAMLHDGDNPLSKATSAAGMTRSDAEKLFNDEWMPRIKEAVAAVAATDAVSKVAPELAKNAKKSQKSGGGAFIVLGLASLGGAAFLMYQEKQAQKAATTAPGAGLQANTSDVGRSEDLVADVERHGDETVVGRQVP